MTVEQLTAWGANTEEGLGRCFNNEPLYIRLVSMMNDDHHAEGLKAALDRDAIKDAFEEAHALKGVLANLALTPVLTPASELTETLRAGNRPDDATVELLLTKMAELKAMINS